MCLIIKGFVGEEVAQRDKCIRPWRQSELVRPRTLDSPMRKDVSDDRTRILRDTGQRSFGDELVTLKQEDISRI